ncbi:phosphatases II [Macrolepiota fuliginosa MF-IS2]|uniref:Phosphatases II n=1 Tax=Macrolepiota fuliginosa MF-IS2 TaxID=1400762 RepID=A0A9P5XFX2_9AGAR|nr:phosphatases II [Macrolepiota fuliginosa MF-IS2]
MPRLPHNHPHISAHMSQPMGNLISAYLKVAATLLPSIIQRRPIPLPSFQDEKALRQFHEQEEERKMTDHYTSLMLTSAIPRPIPNSYWATPLLLACEYPWTPKDPHKPKLDALLCAGVRTFIDLTESGELRPYCGEVLLSRAELLGIDKQTIEYHRFPIHDRCLPQSVEFMYSVMDVLRDNERRGRIAAVHCRGGIGRTGMVIGCWLVESGIARNGEEALAIIAREWKTVEKYNRFPHSPETGPQFNFVLRFQAAPKPMQLISIAS